MATIKLGDLTLGKVAIGGSTIGDVRKLSRAKIFRAEAIKNHNVDKTIAASIVRNENPSQGLGGNSGGDSTWLLSTGYWDDNGVWDDTQTWSD